MALKDIDGPPDDKAKKIAEGISKFANEDSKNYDSYIQELNKKSGLDFSNISDPSSLIAQKMINDAKARTAKGKEGSISVIGDPKNQNTCAAGVCTIAADAGVSFGDMKGTLTTGLAIDEKGRKIPQYNPLIQKQITSSGYYEVPAGEKPKKGDLVQYFENKIPKHLEFITEELPDNMFKTFNNYGLYNYGQGDAWFQDNRANKTDSQSVRTSGNVSVYRLTEEAAKKYTNKENQELLKELAEKRSKFYAAQESLIPNEDPAISNVILNLYKRGQSKEMIKKIINLPATKDRIKDIDYVTRIIDNLK